ncbi:MAG: NAD(P)H-dependent oxidoreductase [Gammaproteobacteria bacterium]|nr:NAD(P)H-dependent oxidoreductase [Gammaproteobacteria bacterium]
MKFLIFLGTVRDSTPPKPPRLGLRVARACRSHLRDADEQNAVELIDPLDLELGAVFKPHFAYSKSKVPEDLDTLAEKIDGADGCVMVSPEYNHSMSPALAHLLNHFGSSLFSYKPSAIVTYSAGQWGGARAAVAMRTFLSELGCLPVSAMIHVPRAHEVFSEDGAIQAGVDADAWADYMGRTFRQLAWWSEAARLQRDRVDPHSQIKVFNRDPSQRNAPDGG